MGNSVNRSDQVKSKINTSLIIEEMCVKRERIKMRQSIAAFSEKLDGLLLDNLIIDRQGCALKGKLSLTVRRKLECEKENQRQNH